MRRSSEVTGAFLGGWRRVFASPVLVGGAWLLTLLAALPAALGVSDAIARHLGSSLMATGVAAGVDRWWWMEFSDQADGAARTLAPDVIGFAAVLSNLSSIFDGLGPPRSVLAPVAVYAILWLFLLGGVLDRLARGRRLGARAFFGACGAFAGRFIRLWLFTLPAWILIGAFWALLFARLFPWVTRDVTAEHVAFAWYVAFCALGLIPLAALLVVVDYARVRAVVEDRRSMIGALAAAIRFARRNVGAVAGLFALNVLTWLALLAAYALLAPGGRGGAWQVVSVLAIGQAYILARIVVRLVVLASATILFQSRLAHARYAAAPRPAWPDSPAAEAIENAARYGVRPRE